MPMAAEALSSPVETFTIELKEAPKGGALGLSWGSTTLSSGFTFGE